MIPNNPKIAEAPTSNANLVANLLVAAETNTLRITLSSSAL
jgi:hypothetical protein